METDLWETNYAPTRKRTEDATYPKDTFLLLERIAEWMVGETWRNIRHDLVGIKLVKLLGPNGTIWQVTEPHPSADKRLKAVEIAPPPPILRVD